MKHLVVALTAIGSIFLLSLTDALAVEGREFWFAIPRPYGNTDSSFELNLFIHSPNASRVTVTMGNGLLLWDSTLSANSSARISLSYNTVTEIFDNLVSKKSIHLVSSAPISATINRYYRGIELGFTNDGNAESFSIIPFPFLGKKYLLSSYNSGEEQFAIIAAHDSTNVHIETDGIINGRPSKNYDVFLMRGEVYFASGIDLAVPQRGLRATTIESMCHPIAVISGNKVSNIPSSASAVNGLIEMLYPTSLWGSDFVSVVSDRQCGYNVLVTANEDNTEVRQDGRLVGTLAKNTSLTIDDIAGSVHWQTSKPSQITQFGYSATYKAPRDSVGDPSMLGLLPLDGFVQTYTADVYQLLKGSYSIDVVCTRGAGSSVSIDGSTPIFLPTVDGQYEVAHVNASLGIHTVNSSSPEGFVASISGIGTYDSYSSSSGVQFVPPSKLDSNTLVATIIANDTMYVGSNSIATFLSSIETTETYWWIDGSVVSSNSTRIDIVFDKAGTHVIELDILTRRCERLRISKTIYVDTLPTLTFLLPDRTVAVGDSVEIPLRLTSQYTRVAVESIRMKNAEFTFTSRNDFARFHSNSENVVVTESRHNIDPLLNVVAFTVKDFAPSSDGIFAVLTANTFLPQDNQTATPLRWTKYPVKQDSIRFVGRDGSLQLTSCFLSGRIIELAGFLKTSITLNENTIQLSITPNISGEYRCSVYSSGGVEISNTSFSCTSGHEAFAGIPFDDVTIGLYFLRITTPLETVVIPFTSSR